MELRTCRMCQKLYSYIGKTTPFCPRCMKELEDKFDRCKRFIKENPGANVQVVSEKTEVSIKMIKQWVREERLIFTDKSLVGIECENCGASILTGRFCAQCKQKLSNSLSDSIKKPQAPTPVQQQKSSGGRMRFLDE